MSLMSFCHFTCFFPIINIPVGLSCSIISFSKGFIAYFQKDKKYKGYTPKEWFNFSGLSLLYSIPLIGNFIAITSYFNNLNVFPA